MTNNATTARPATPRQLRYLRALADQTGTTFTTPGNSTHASREIARLQRLRATRGTHCDLPQDDVRGVQPGYATAPQDGALDRWGCERGSPRTTPSTRPTAPPAPERQPLAQYTAAGQHRVIYADRARDSVCLTDRPAAGSGRAYLIERGLEHDDTAALDALVADYLQQASELDRVPMQPGAHG
jgi:hypothetical protein